MTLLVLNDDGALGEVIFEGGAPNSVLA